MSTKPKMTAAAAGSNKQFAAPTVQNFTIRIPKVSNKKYSIMGFRGSTPIEFSEWERVIMERENAAVPPKQTDDNPKFGAGSEYRKDQREEAKRIKHGYVSNKNKTNHNPWIIQHGLKNDKKTKKYRGIREGGVTENASYYVLCQAADGAFEAFPVEEWYKFQLVPNYNHLSYEEAEAAFSKRDDTFNYFDVMVRNRMKEAAGEEEEPLNKKPADSKRNQAKKRVATKKANDDMDSLDEAFEDSDNGDGEGRELDYVSSSDEASEPEELETKNHPKGVAEEEALRKILNSEDEDQDEGQNQDQDQVEDVGSKDQDIDSETKDQDHKNQPKAKKKNQNKVKKPRREDYGSTSPSSDSSSDSDTEPAISVPKLSKTDSSDSASTKGIPKLVIVKESDGKRKIASSSNTPIKKPRFSVPATHHTSTSNDQVLITEEQVRSYLSRGKPITACELVQKFKHKKLGMSSEQLTTSLANILESIAPHKKLIHNKLHFSMRPFTSGTLDPTSDFWPIPKRLFNFIYSTWIINASSVYPCCLAVLYVSINQPN